MYVLIYVTLIHFVFEQYPWMRTNADAYLNLKILLDM